VIISKDKNHLRIYIAVTPSITNNISFTNVKNKSNISLIIEVMNIKDKQKIFMEVQD